MHTRTKRILPLLLLCVALFVMALCVSAETKTGTCGENLTYTLDTDTGVLTISGTGEMANWDWEQRAPWDSDSDAIRTVVVVDGVTSIGNCAFENCSGFTSITISNSVISIGYSAFENCINLTNITIPNSVVSIGNYAFLGCTGLGSITIPDSVESIGKLAFSSCTGLSGIYVNASNSSYISVDGVLLNKNKTTLIQAPGAFWGTYVIPDSVMSIGQSAFQGCINLTGIIIPDSVMSIGESAFSKCGSLTSVTIPYGVAIIEESVFSGCNSLTNITIPDSVMSIENFAFYGCENLSNIIIPANVASLGQFVFSRCSSLASIVIPDGVTSIMYNAFSDCSSLMNITIPDSVTSIGESAFSGCSSLISITIPYGVASIRRYAFYDCSSLANITIPEGVTNIGYSAFYGCRDLASISIPSSMANIGPYAFKGCSSLVNITIPDGVMIIGYSAFSGCSSLASITIPSGVTSVQDGVFWGCGSLTSITVPDGVTSIGNCAFENCSSLTSITILNPKCNIYNVYDNQYTIPENATIYGYTGSTAEAYAEKYNRAFVALDKPAQDEDTKGDIITFGSYPQSKVTDSALIAKLDAQSGSWVSYNYYIEREVSDFMQYKDVTLDGARYRAVKFASYRPSYTGNSSSASSSYQGDNGYIPNTIYWFKYEPVKWRVLDASDPENLLVLSESILDSQAFRETRYSYSSKNSYYYYTDSTMTYYANNYEQSNIRAWLNGDFYNTTFSADEKSHIHTTTITNEAYSTAYSKYDAASTQDKIFLMSYKEATNFACFNNSVARYAEGSNYAKAMGLYVSSSGGTAGNSMWLLRSAGDYSYSACCVEHDGIIRSNIDVCIAAAGIRPAFRFTSASLTACDHVWTVTATQPVNCTTPGSKTFECTKCGETKTEVIPVNDDHDYSTVWAVDTPATCTAVGSKSHHCVRCDAKTDITEIPKTAHTYVDGVCTACGKAKTAYTPGVVTGEGEKPMKKDLLRLQKYLAGWDVEIDKEAADCNGDGVISKADLLRLQKYLAGWEVKLGE